MYKCINKYVYIYSTFPKRWHPRCRSTFRHSRGIRDGVRNGVRKDDRKGDRVNVFEMALAHVRSARCGTWYARSLSRMLMMELAGTHDFIIFPAECIIMNECVTFDTI